jgi:hypothetical protein
VCAHGGLTVTSWQHEPRTITDQIRVVSEEWVADKGLPEMGFTLGGLDELADDDVRLMPKPCSSRLRAAVNDRRGCGVSC